ncbi:ENTH-domain-containing protein [Trametopsis cervina]|nr:ENTH-domain-containing protein [Trametopsis cervina]
MQLGRATVRAAKAVTKGYSDAQSKVRHATQNDPSSPTARELDDIAHLTYNHMDFIEIMEVLDKRLNDKGKLWRHVYKALVVINHLLYTGSPQVYQYCHNNLYVFKTLREFQYRDDADADVGQNVRSEAKEVTRLLMSPDELKNKRNGNRRSYDDPLRGASAGRERERKRSEEIQAARRRSQQEESQRQTSEEDQELQKAIELSKREEEERLRAISDSNKGGLFDQTSLSSQKKSDDLLIDLSDSDTISTPIQVQYTQVPLPAQYTAYPGQQHPQYTSTFSSFQIDPQYTYGAQQEAMQAEYLRQQAEWQAQMQAQQQQQQLEQQRQQQLLQWQAQQAQQTQQQQQEQSYLQPIVPQTTSIGSNNPFAPSPSHSPLHGYRPSPSPSLSSTSSATASSRRSPATPFTTRTGPSPGVYDERHAQLASLYAMRGSGVGSKGEDGVDTFGNIGALRYMSGVATHRTSAF